MRKQALCWLIVIPLILLTGCKPAKLNIYSIIEINDTGYIVSDGTNAFEYQNGVYTHLGIQYTTYKAIKPLEQFEPTYRLIHKDLSSYTGTLQDAAGYINYLLTLDYTVESTLYNSSTLDVLLTSERDEIRVLYLGGEVVRVFYRNFVDGSSMPPYIYVEE